ncbi:NAD(P)H:quinone oxidoreductase [Pontibacter sp. SD6]|uniref:NAD(P)H:quinone oxidoreductase n=2 Tax=Pontibacter cellulosilyticus TaxID=1720253 RepID=A0A923N2V6_9BACT|nr:NAD(P)H:quinone oxidoreductase [Pontibacter cellulosilyticus]
MTNVKLAVIYYSATGTNYQLAQWAAKGAREMGAEVRICKVPELAAQSAIDANPAWKAHLKATEDVPVVSLDDLVWADAYVFSIPTRYGNMPSQVKQFLDTTGGLWFTGKLANKVVSAMVSASNPHGGQETTILGLYTTMFHWGAIIAAPGYTDPAVFAAGGNPYGTSVTAGVELKEETRLAVMHQVRRTITVALGVQYGLKISSHQALQEA